MPLFNHRGLFAKNARTRHKTGDTQTARKEPAKPFQAHCTNAAQRLELQEKTENLARRSTTTTAPPTDSLRHRRAVAIAARLLHAAGSCSYGHCTGSAHRHRQAHLPLCPSTPHHDSMGMYAHKNEPDMQNQLQAIRSTSILVHPHRKIPTTHLYSADNRHRR